MEISDGPILWVRIEGLEQDRILWWRAVPLDGSRFEIGFLAWSGLLADLTLVCVAKERIRIVEEWNPLGQGVESLPVFDKNPWPPDTHHMTTRVEDRLTYIEEPVLLDLTIGPSGLSFLFDGPCAITEVLSFDRLRLGLDQARHLRRVDVVDLTADEMRAVRETTKDKGGIPPQDVPYDVESTDYGPWASSGLQRDRTPGRIAGRNFFGERLRGQIDDGNIIRRAIRRIKRFAVGGKSDTPRPRPAGGDERQ